jgi:hypothetical protein
MKHWILGINEIGYNQLSIPSLHRKNTNRNQSLETDHRLSSRGLLLFIILSLFWKIYWVGFCPTVNRLLWAHHNQRKIFETRVLHLDGTVVRLPDSVAVCLCTVVKPTNIFDDSLDLITSSFIVAIIPSSIWAGDIITLWITFFYTYPFYDNNGFREVWSKIDIIT